MTARCAHDRFRRLATTRIASDESGEPRAIAARWVVDASGRAGLIKRKLDLAEGNDHDANAVWWRVDGYVDPNQWSDDPEWLSRCTPPDRWRSTNHMCGPGYWFWLIPLSSGSHSLGIVCDAKMHPLDTMNTHEKAMAWLREHQPQVAASVDKPDCAQDCLFLRTSPTFKHGFRRPCALTARRICSCSVLSPGSTTPHNTYICDLSHGSLRAGVAQPALFSSTSFLVHRNTLTLYQDHTRCRRRAGIRSR